MKYKNKKKEIDGHVFDSKMESDYYVYLKEQQTKGEVLEIELQPVYLLQPAFKKMGHSIRKIEYKADFLVTYADGRKILYDVKGFSTKDFKIKAKMFDYYYPDLELQIITKHKNKWILLKDKK